MFQLKLLGGPSIKMESGTPVVGRAAQRHRLALLALLALSGRRGIGRERLMALLWPESDEAHARNLLKVSVYVLRQALGQEALLYEGDNLRLNARRVEVDVAQFTAALERRDHEEAVKIYHGPFLDGFFLKGTQEFESWVDRERQRLADEHSRALEVLAERAEVRGDLAAAVEWWKARAAVDPWDSRVAVRLMRALAASGNPAGALNHAAIHERLLQESLGLPVAPEVAELASRLRAEPVRTPERDADAGPPHMSARREGARSVPVMGQGWRRNSGLRRWHLAAALTLGALVLLRPEPSPTDEDAPRIAVLPIRSVDPQDDGLADAMTWELISILGREPDRLRAISFQSVVRYRGSDVDVRAIADTLHVSRILEGSLQTRDGRVRLVLDLVDARDGSLGWSRTSEAEFRDLFPELGNLAGLVAEELGIRLAGLAGTGLFSGAAGDDSISDRRVAAVDLYIQGHRGVLWRTADGRRQARDLFRRAIEMDSTYAPPHASLAQWMGVGDNTGRSRRESLALAEKEARTATGLDSLLAEGHVALGRVLMDEYRFAEAETELRRGLALDPTRAGLRQFLVWLYAFLDKPREALEQAERAVADEPYSLAAVAELGRAWLLNGRCDRAMETLSQLAELQPPPARAAAIAAQCLAREGRWQDAVDVLRPVAEHNPVQAEPWLGWMLARGGRTEEARRILDRRIQQARNGEGDAFAVAVVLAGLGEYDEAFAWLETSIDDRSLRFDIMEPAFEDLHRDPRFRELRRRLGIPGA